MAEKDKVTIKTSVYAQLKKKQDKQIREVKMQLKKLQGKSRKRKHDSDYSDSDSL